MEGTRLEEKYILAFLSKKKLLSENIGSGLAIIFNVI